MQNGDRKRRAVRFSMGTLLFLVLCMCGYLAGHKQGYRDGKALWDIMPLYHQVYLAEDLETSVDELATSISREVVPECWKDAGGNCTIKAFVENKSLVVGANQYVHEELVKYFKTLRDEMTMASAVDQAPNQLK